MKLKTLKDLERKANPDFVYSKEIKAEAVKWVKEDEKWIKGIKDEDTQQELIIYMYEWMKRLNLTEEDLK